MALLSEVALTHDVFDSTSFASEGSGDAHLRYLKDFLLNEAIVRNLRDGEWCGVFREKERPWHKRGLELLKKLVSQRRLVRRPPALIAAPTTDQEWFGEAVASHGILPLDAIISTSRVAGEVAVDSTIDPLVSPLEKLTSTPVWGERGPSARLERTRKAMEGQLNLILRNANSIMFIDPHLDPTLPRYAGFVGMLNDLAGRDLKPLLEIHRVVYVGSGPTRDLVPMSEWRDRFASSMSEMLKEMGASITVFIWDHFHCRHVISNLMGILLENGLDTSRRPGEITTWSRMGRRDRDDVQREFDPASGRHTLRDRFTVPE